MNTVLFSFFSCLGLCLSQEGHSGEKELPVVSTESKSVDDFFKKYDFVGSETILDVGSGDGRITALLAQKVKLGKVVGVDISSALVDVAKAKYKGASPNLEFRVNNAADLSYVHEFDLITSFMAMHWVLDQDSALNGFFQGLKPGGKIWIQMPMGLPKNFIHALQKVLVADKWKKYFTTFTPPWKFYTPAEYRDLLVDHQFKPLKISVYNKEDEFGSKEAFSCFLRKWLPYLHAVPVEEKELLLEEIANSYLSTHLADNQGKIKFSVQTLEV